MVPALICANPLIPGAICRPLTSNNPNKTRRSAMALLSGLKALETQLIFEVRLIEFRGMLSKSLQNGGFLEEGDAQNL